MFNVAAQARNTYDATDLKIALLFPNLAAATWVALQLPSLLGARGIGFASLVINRLNE